MKSFKCTLITPQGSLFDNTSTSVSAPGAEGRFQVLAGHEHIMAILKKGVLKIKAEATDLFYALDSGVLEVDGNHDVVILADKALKAETESDAKQKIAELDVK